MLLVGRGLPDPGWLCLHRSCFCGRGFVAAAEQLNVGNVDWRKSCLEHLWRDLKIAVHQQLPFNLTELEKICKEEWQNIPLFRSPKDQKISARSYRYPQPYTDMARTGN
ncbi:uncharacterized protein LOC131200689 isoform X2 [Ahaetulla prasina]|uniref:uncharacterized protein LOC131200689 isoform X2 n=1 Tax=Ahaetulla prasina TaxID=499056 RepID=UPI0026476753|nr:uncharacterized protein LOC131200689 isoform X2 [Ahaetulla prasina]